MARGVGGEGGAAGGRDPNAGGRGGGGGQGGRGGGSFGERFNVGDFGGGSRGVGGEGGARGGRDPQGGARAGGGTGNSGRGGGTFQGGTGLTRDTMAGQDQVGANVAAAQNDFNDTDNSFGDDIGNMMASFLGFNEQDPTVPGYSGPGMPGQTARAGWGFDPAGLIGGAAGMGFGLPLTGFLADQASALLGRPLEVSLGPDVFDFDTVDPETGVTTAGATHTGPSMSIQDGEDRNTFVGTSPALNFIGNQAANNVAGKRTMTGVDPSPVDPAPEQPAEPVTPQPSSYEQPNNMQIDPGNTGLSSQQLTDLFAGFMQPGRTSRGRNPARVVT